MLVQFGLYGGPGLCRTGTWMTSRYDASAVMLDATEPERVFQCGALKRAFFGFFPRRRHFWVSGATKMPRMSPTQLRQLARRNFSQLEKKQEEEEMKEEEEAAGGASSWTLLLHQLLLRLQLPIRAGIRF